MAMIRRFVHYKSILLSMLIVCYGPGPIEAQRNTVVEQNLSAGLEIFKFDMGIEEFRRMLPRSTSYDLPEFRQLAGGTVQTEGIGLSDFVSLPRFHVFRRLLYDFEELRFAWAFQREAPILRAIPTAESTLCWSRIFATVLFIFEKQRLMWIRVTAHDYPPNCLSHEAAFNAIADFYGVARVSKKIGRLGINLQTDATLRHIISGFVEGTTDIRKQGLKVGDEIVSIDGEMIRNKSLSEVDVRNYFWGEPGSVATLAVNRGDTFISALHVPRMSIIDGIFFTANTNTVCLSGMRVSGDSVVNIRKPTPDFPCMKHVLDLPKVDR